MRNAGCQPSLRFHHAELKYILGLVEIVVDVRINSPYFLIPIEIKG